MLPVPLKHCQTSDFYFVTDTFTNHEQPEMCKEKCFFSHIRAVYCYCMCFKIYNQHRIKWSFLTKMKCLCVSWYLNDDGGAFVHCDDSVIVDPSEPLQRGTMAPLEHRHIKPVTDMFHQIIKQRSSGLGGRVKKLQKKKKIAFAVWR